MTKATGLGDALFIGGYRLSNDIGSLSRIGGGPAASDVTGIDKEAYERKGGIRTGGMDFSAWFNDAAGQAHAILSPLPTSNVYVTYCRGLGTLKEACSMMARQVGYDPNRTQEGALTMAVSVESDQYGLEWGQQHTNGVRSDSAATNGSGVDGGAATTHGLQAYLHVISFTGTSVTVKLQESSDNGAGDAWADVTGGAFSAANAVGVQRIATGTQNIERYLRVVTSGTFSEASFIVNVVRNQTAVTF